MNSTQVALFLLYGQDIIKICLFVIKYSLHMHTYIHKYIYRDVPMKGKN